MPAIRHPALLILLAVAGLGAVEGEPEVAPLLSIREHIQKLSEENLQLQLKLPGVVSGGVDLTLDRSRGVWREGSATAGNFNKAIHSCRAGEDLVVADGKVTGTIIVHINPDQWVPEDKQAHDVSCTVDLALNTGSGEGAVWPVSGTVSGRTLTTAGTLGDEFSEAVTGRAVKPIAGGFTRGTWDDGLALDFDLGDKRVNWNRFQLTRHGYHEPQDWTGFDGLRVAVRTAVPRDDVSVTVWAKEDDGSWYYAKDVVPLIDGENVGTAWFEDFTLAEWVCPAKWAKTGDEDYTLDRSLIGEFAIGVVNPLGVGEVSFTVTVIDTVSTGAEAETASVAVLGKTLDVNGHEMVPAGIFGGYAPYLPAKYRPGCQRAYHTLPGGGPSPCANGEKFIIEMWGDRTQAATLLKNPDGWEQWLIRATRAYGEKAKAKPEEAVLEFWNEPYLDWAKGKNYNPKFFDQSRAEEGGPVTTTGGIEIPHFKWTRRNGEWKVVDETQFTYWSGKGNGYIYDRMATVVGKTLHETCPEASYIVGWGKKWNEDHWAMWEMLVKPTIDNTIEWIDGCHEHHYQGDTLSIPGTYEVLTAYGMAEYDKWLYSYNTETNELIDVPSRGYVETAAEAKRAQAFKRLTYNMRDCLGCVAFTPDKGLGRTVIHLDHTPQATDIAYGLMSELRGRLVGTSSSDDKVWCLASIDGTDPRAARDDDKRRLVVFVWNDHRRPQTVRVEVAAPTGTALAGGRQDEVVLDREDFSFRLKTGELEAVGESFSAELTIPHRRAVKLSFDLTGEPVDTAEVLRRQFFADDILQQVGRDVPWRTAVQIPAAARAGAKRAWLRCVLESVSDGEAVATVGGTDIVLPRTITGSNVNRIREVAIPLEELADEVPLTFAVAAGNHAGYQVDMASIVIER